MATGREHHMTGPAHYELAELHLEQASSLARLEELGEEEEVAMDYLLRSAKVHAALALVAATVSAAPQGLDRADAEQWRECILE